MYVNRRSWFLTALSLTTAGVMMAAPAVWADDDKKGGDDHDKNVVKVENENENEHAAPAVVKVENENEAPEVENEAAEPAVPAANMSVRAANLVAAFNTQTAELAALTAMTAAPTDVEEDNDDIEANEAFGEFQVVNLSTLTAGLTGANLASVNNAANADATAAAAFLNGSSAAGMAIKAQLAAAGINPANVLAILSRGEDHVTIVLNA